MEPLIGTKLIIVIIIIIIIVILILFFIIIIIIIVVIVIHLKYAQSHNSVQERSICINVC